MGGRSVDITGEKYGRLTVVRYSHKNKFGKKVWACLCDCGNEFLVESYSMKSGNTKSCGCLTRERLIALQTKHDGYTHPNYGSWKAMRQRCYLTTTTYYERYGGRGITVQDSWNDEYTGLAAFIEDMGIRPEGMSIDRIDVNGNYTKENCRWADTKTQVINQRKNKRNTSGRTGVYFHEKHQTWWASISIDGKVKYLKGGLTFEEACEVRATAELEHYGFIKE